MAGKDSAAGAGRRRRTRVVGREPELAELAELLAAAAVGRGAVCLITGEPGIGKTSLATAFAEDVRGEATVLWGASWAAGTAPAYWPWRQALRALLERDGAEALREALGAAAGHAAAVLPELGAEPPAGLDTEPSRFPVFDAIATLLTVASRSGPIVVVLDDLHDADAPSIALLEFLARALGGCRVLFVATAREREAALREDIGTALTRVGPDTRHIALGGLGREDVGVLVAERGPAEADEAFVGSLLERTNGNPLFLGELLTLAGRDAGAQPSSLPLPASLRDTIRRRLSPLAPEVVDLLGVASVAGVEFPLGVVADAAGRAPGDALALLEPALALGLVEEGRHGADLRFGFPHALVRETLYEGLSPRRRAELHQAVGEALERRLDTPAAPPLAELAHHFAGAAALGGAQRARDYAARAAEHALAVSAWEEAVRQFAVALELHGQGGEDQEALCDLLLGLGRAQARSGDVETARATLIRAADVARALGSSRRFGLAVLELGAVGLPPGGSDEEVVGLLEEALDLVDEAPTAVRARVLARLAVQLYWTGEPERIGALVAEARAIADGLDDPAARLDVLASLHLATSGPESPERLAELDRLLALAARAEDAEHELQVRIWRVAALLQLDELRAAAAEIEAIARLSARVQQPRWEWYVPLLRGVRALVEGRLDDAERMREEAGAIGLQVHGSMAPQLLGALLVATRWTQRALGDLLEPVTTLADASPSVPAWRCVRVATLVDAGRDTEARAELARLVPEGRPALRRDTTFLPSCALLADAAARLGEAAPARALYDALLPYAARNATLPSGAFVGPVERHLGVLAATIGDEDAARRHLAAARASAQRGDMRAMLELIAQDEAALGAPPAAPAEPEARGAPEAGRAPAAAPASGAAEGLLRREGDVWTVAVDGRSVRLRHAKGLDYLAELVVRPGVEIHAVDLVGARSSGADERALDDGDLGPVLDAEAKAAYRERVEDLRAEIEEAEAFRDPERAARAREEMELIAAELSRAVGLGGRDRRPGSTAERARVNATRAIKSVLRRIADHDEALAQELLTTVGTGTYCAYRPDPRRPVRWRVEGR